MSDKPFISKLLHLLHDEFFNEIRVSLKDFPRHVEETVSEVKGKRLVTDKAVNNILIGKTKNISKKTKTALFIYFKPMFDNIKPNNTLSEECFSAGSITHFQRMASFEFSKYVDTNIPVEPNIIKPSDLNDIRKLFRIQYGDEAVFDVYKYSFKGFTDKKTRINHEILRIYEENSRILFEMRFKVSDESGNIDQSPIRIVRGLLLKIGMSYAFFGMPVDDIKEKRPRILLLKNEEFDPELNNYRFGILTSLSTFSYEPVSCRVALLKKDCKKYSDIQADTEGKIGHMTIESLKSRMGDKKAEHLLEAISNKVSHDSGILTTNTAIFSKKMAGV